MNVRAARHLVLARVGHDKPLAEEFVSAFHARRQHRMALCRVAADHEDQCGLCNIFNRTGVATVSHCAEEAHCRGRLTIPRAVIDVVRADDGARELLHQIAVFVGGLR